jgi:hypothetical protein
MNKVWVVAGVILFLVLLLGAWLFIVDFGGFSQLLGQKTKEAFRDEILRFVGTWHASEFGTITFFATQTYRKGIDEGTWKLQNHTLALYKLDSSQPFVTYQYSFSMNDTTLQFTEINSADSIVLTRQN